MTLIENSDRGITLNKQFAYTLLCGFVGVGFWVGVTVTQLGAKIDHLTQKETERSAQIAALQARLGLLERNESAVSVKLTSIDSSIQEVKSSIDSLNRRLSGAVQ